VLVAIAVLGSAADARAQCSVGWPLYHDCMGVTWEGCCTAKNTQIGPVTTLQWCENGFLCTALCNPLLDQICGWITSGGQGLYDCIDATYITDVSQLPDPSGKHAYGCQIPCGDVGYEGCCEGQTLLKYCKNGSLNLLDCSQNDAKYGFCGWDPVMGSYGCTSSAIPGPAGHPYTCGSTTCQPACAGKQCGSDGCGSSCGTCPAGQTCDGAGACKSGPCVPACSGKQCGPDGCGSSCGTCAAGNICGENGQCHPQGCDPQCDGKDCGPDGCGGTCGACPGLSTCSALQKCSFICQSDCTNKECGDDLCGGVCGTCQPPESCVYFHCVAPGEDPGQPPEPPPEPGEEVDAPDGIIYLSDPPGGPEDDGCPEGTTQRYGSCVPVVAEPQPKAAGGCGAGPAGPGGAGVLAALAVAWLWRRGRRPAAGGGRKP
jgi:uncharacterized protein (TIGR03382 family)